MKIIPLSLASLLCAACGSLNGPHNLKTTSASHNKETDVQITNRVKSALASDNALTGTMRNVFVETTNGVVTLTGSVPTVEESRNIERKVKSIKEVSSVDNQLIIKP